MSNAILSLYSKLFSLRNSRYVNRFVLPPKKYEPGRNKIMNEKEQEALDNLKAGITNIHGMVEKYPVIKELKETIFMVVEDLDNLKFTLEVENGDANVTMGWDASKKPTMILPLYSINLGNLKKMTADNEVGLDDIYRFTRVLFIPFLKSLYQADHSNLPKDKSYMQLDNLIHVEVFNENGVEVDGFPGPAQATVVNVDGQWLIFEGFQGDPDIKYSMNIKQGLEFAYLIKVRILKRAPTVNINELLPDLKKYNDLKKKVAVYERKWHNVEELG